MLRTVQHLAGIRAPFAGQLFGVVFANTSFQPIFFLKIDLFLGLILHYLILLPIVLLQDSLVLPQWLLVLAERAKEQTLCLYLVGIEHSDEENIVGKFYLAQTYFTILPPHSLILLPILINALPMALLAPFNDLALVYLSTREDIDSIAIHSILEPISIVNIVAVEQVQTFS
jgi:hypothetical protein